jgi:hypothetical protein
MKNPEYGGDAGRRHGLALASGLFLLAAFFGLTQTGTGFTIAYIRPFTYSPPGESYFWLASALLLFPAACLLGFGLAPWLGPKIGSAWTRVNNLGRRQNVTALAALLVLATGSAGLSHALVLRGTPITDDENGARYGGQVMARGKIKVPAPEPESLFPGLFLYSRGGFTTSVDWPGSQAAWAVAEATHTGPWVFALFAGAAALAVSWAAGLHLSPGYGLVAFLLFLGSPMAFTLSATTHAHVVSRGLIGLTFLFYIRAERRRGAGRWALAGFAAAAAFTVRPVETTFLLLPLGLDLVLRERRTAEGRRRLGAFLLGAAGPLILFVVHNALVTGNPFVPARFFMEGPAEAFFRGSPWNRFGANTSYNLFMLAVWFLGPLGILAVACGVLANRFTKLLGLGVLAMLLAGLFHDNHGLHIVGPIHYSECAVPLTLIAVRGLAAIKGFVVRAGLRPERFASLVLAALVLGLGVFNVWEARALNRQAWIQSTIYGAIEKGVAAGTHNRAVVLVPKYGDVWENHPPFKKIGCWLWEWRRPRPDLADRILLVRDAPGAAAAMKARFPDRPQFRFSRIDRPPYFVIKPAGE